MARRGAVSGLCEREVGCGCQILRTLQRNAVEIEVAPLKPLMKSEKRAMTVAAEQYGIFLELPVMLTWHEIKAA